MTLKPGTRCETFAQVDYYGFVRPPEGLKIMRPRAEHLPLPGPDWYIVRYDNGDRMCVHRQHFRVIDNR